DLSQAPWARSAVDTLLGANLVAGVAPGVFDPNGTLTRAQFATLLVKADGLAPVASGKSPFTDVSPAAWYAPYVAAAYNAGLVSGVSSHTPTFDPNGSITREQMALMLAKLLGSSAPAGSLSRFSDASSIAPWAQSGVAAAVGAGLMTGFHNGTFRPTGLSTRAQAAAVLAKYLSYVGKV
ncbi:MAG: S-layer homology domain-containing protein, partial [Thermaerobacter sp.]|nr:S-layer homology domain-containing protein [Thermaerobacter sp.]